jgi:hypothetical protein
MSKVFKTMSEANAYFLQEQLKRESEFTIKYTLNPEQIFLLKLFFFNEYIYLYQYIEQLTKTQKKNLANNISELYEKGIVDSRWVIVNSDYPDQIKISDEFLNEILICFGMEQDVYHQMIDEEDRKKRFVATYGEEFFDVYPTSVNGYVLKACNPIELDGKTYSGKTNIIKLYCEQIGYDLTKHREIISKIKSDKSNGSEVCRMTITKFVRDKLWESIKIVNWDDNV